MMNAQWYPISSYTDAALRRMAATPRDLRCEAAAHELARRAAGGRY